jgi:hypothetical protein
VRIINGYPSYECEIVLFLSNRGSIPFNIIGANFTNADETAGGDPALETSEECFSTGTDPQVDPGEERRISCIIHVLQEAEQNDCTASSETSTVVGGVVVSGIECSGPGDSPLVVYDFSLEVCVAQWNEDPSTGTTPNGPFDEADFLACKTSIQHEGPTGPTDDNNHTP